MRLQQSHIWSPNTASDIKTRPCLFYLHAHTHTYTHRHTHMQAYIHTHTHTDTHTDTHMHTPMHAYIHTYIHTPAHTHTCIHTHTYIHTYIHTGISFRNLCEKLLLVLLLCSKSARKMRSNQATAIWEQVLPSSCIPINRHLVGGPILFGWSVGTTSGRISPCGPGLASARRSSSGSSSTKNPMTNTSLMKLRFDCNSPIFGAPIPHTTRREYQEARTKLWGCRRSRATRCMFRGLCQFPQMPAPAS